MASWAGATALDFERDGDLDVIAVAAAREPLLLLNDGNGNLSVAPPGRFPASPLPMYRIDAADVDGDGFEDVLITGATNQLWRNDRAGRFVDITATHLPTWSAGVMDIQAADLDNDSDVDFALAQIDPTGFGHSNAVLLNQGGGRFAYQLLRDTPQRYAWAAVADFTRDGLPDLVFGSPSGPAAYWINQGGGVFFDGSAFATNVLLAADGAAGDLDGDGWPDLLISSYQGPATHLEIHLNLGGQGFTLAPGGVSQYQPRFTVSNVELRDMDRDGDLDAVVRGAYSIPINHLAFWVVPNTTRHVLSNITIQPGGTWLMTLWARPQDVVVPALAAAHAETPLGALGMLGLDPASLVALAPVSMTAWSHAITLPVPATPWLIGRRIWAQAVVVPASQPLAPRLTNWVDTEIVR